MRRRALSRRLALPWALACGASLAFACDEKGITSICPPLPLYQTYPLGDASPPDAASPDSKATRAALAAAVDAGCATALTDFPYDASAGAAGEAGAFSDAGSAGSAVSRAGAAAGH